MKTDGSKQERRKEKRYKAKENTFALIRFEKNTMDPIKGMSMGEIGFAVFKSNPFKIGRLIDINLDGLAMEYIEDDRLTLKSGQMDILSATQGFYLNGLFFHTVSDIDVSDTHWTSSMKTRRQGVRFNEISFAQRSMLKCFINYHTEPKPFESSRRFPFRADQAAGPDKKSSNPFSA